jgi:hypothetical protein
MGNFRHEWIKLKKSESSNNKAAKFLKQIYPSYSDDEIELLIILNDTRDIKNLAREHGWDEKRIKSEL